MACKRPESITEGQSSGCDNAKTQFYCRDAELAKRTSERAFFCLGVSTVKKDFSASSAVKVLFFLTRGGCDKGKTQFYRRDAELAKRTSEKAFFLRSRRLRGEKGFFGALGGEGFDFAYPPKRDGEKA